ncbi:MAG: esterase-like activity of phytase family protein [Planctomycetes bacterium]|nr:esterase-like activity of phytase family protein [Planctomycetota bacterium]MCB9910273.1 esterase-like activity of phytase family protein [Planctomycetota bacterium]HPF13720.1 esterase-like activity of phytase family protein [Planctomycetota bacterium]HRV79860.1 esterase-like activity of phytase family protein [Planctomycetota bacterium]
MNIPTLSAASALLLAFPALGAQQATELYQGPFERIASFPVFLNTDVDNETVAEIVTSALGGQLLLYTDSAMGRLGFIDIADPHNPEPGGTVDLGGEPTSVTVKGNYALVCVNTSADYVNTSGNLVVIDVNTHQIVQTLPLGGQPDCIDISPDGRYAAICIENERDEDLGNGEPPQAPAGYLVIADLVGTPDHWTTRTVDLTGIADLYPEDPEPEFVDINALNIAAITLQENNHCILVRLSTGTVLYDFSCGTVDLDQIDTNENDLIEPTSSLQSVPREPDAIAWTSLLTLATADEGDLFGGSRGFTTWTLWGAPLFQAGNQYVHFAMGLGHYPEDRSENKGSEPEGVAYARYGADRYLFVGSERANMVIVYQMWGLPWLANRFPIALQVLPTGVGPEGLHTIPERNLFVVANEVDDRGAGIRSTVMIYAKTGHSNYPDVASKTRADGTPIPWAALSGLAVRGQNNHAYAVHDNFYRKSRIYDMRLFAGNRPSEIRGELPLVDSQGLLLAALTDLKAQLPGTPDFDPAASIEADGTVNLDLEGIDVAPGGRFWVVSEGAGNLDNGVSDPNDRPFETPNLLVLVEADGTIGRAILPPLAMTQNQLRFGLEGVARRGSDLYVAFQREWSQAGDASGLVRIGRYDLKADQWTFAHYPLDAATSPNGGWVGLSEIVHLGGAEFAVIERDNQVGPDARIKRIYRFSVAGVSFQPESQVANFPVLTKHLISDLLAAGLYDSTGGLVPEKLEGMALTSDGTLWIVNDNDGLDDNNGETRLVRVPVSGK